MIWIRRILMFASGVFLLALLVTNFKHHLWPWFEIHTGTVNESGPYYGFWSGFGSDLGEATIVGAVFAAAAGAWQHHNCHVSRCLWPGRPVAGTPYVACPKHHPGHHGEKRGVSLGHIHEAHAAAQVSGPSLDTATTCGTLEEMQ